MGDMNQNRRITIEERLADRAIDGLDALTYSVDHYLGSGAIGAVYRAYPAGEETSDGDNPPFVVKVKDRDSQATDDDFKLEYDVLKGIYEQATSDRARAGIPAVASGLVERTGAPALLMPYYDDDERVETRLTEIFASEAVNQAIIKDAETLALEVARTYSQIMMALRASEYTVTDRKTKDFYWRDGQVVVLDWNVIGEMSPEYYEAEVGQLASLWHALLLNRAASARLVVHDDDRWQRIGVDQIDGGTVSVGFRLILAAARNTPVEQLFIYEGQPSYVAVDACLAAWSTLVDTPYPATEAPADITPDETAWARFVETLPLDAIDDTLRDLAYYDLQWRKAQLADLEAHVDYWWQQRQDCVQQLRARVTDDIQTRIDGDDALLALLDNADVRGAETEAEKQADAYRAAGEVAYAEHKQRWVRVLTVMTTLLRAQQRIQQQARPLLRGIGLQMAQAPRLDQDNMIANVREKITTCRAIITELDDERYQSALDTLTMFDRELDLRERASQYRRTQAISDKLDILRKADAWVDEIDYLSHHADAGQTLYDQVLPFNHVLVQIDHFLHADDHTTVIDRAQALLGEVQWYQRQRNINDGDRRELLANIEPYTSAAKTLRDFNNGRTPHITAVLRDYAPLLNNDALASLHRWLALDVYKHIARVYDDLATVIDTPTRTAVEQAIPAGRALVMHKQVVKQSLAIAEQESDYESRLMDDMQKEHGWELIKQRVTDVGKLREYFSKWDQTMERLRRDAGTVDSTELRDLLQKARDLNMSMTELTGDETPRSVDQLYDLLEQAIQSAEDTTGEVQQLRAKVDEYEKTIQDYQQTVNQYENAVINAKQKYDEASKNQLAQINERLQQELDHVRQMAREASREMLERQVRENITPRLARKLEPDALSAYAKREAIDEQRQRIEALQAQLERKIDERMRAVRGEMFDSYLGWLQAVSQQDQPAKVIANWLNEAYVEIQQLPDYALTAERFKQWNSACNQLWMTLKSKLEARANAETNNKRKQTLKVMLDQYASDHSAEIKRAQKRIESA